MRLIVAAAAALVPALQAVVPAPVNPSIALQDTSLAAADAFDAQQDTIVVEAERRPPPGDPLEHINEKSYIATQAVDKAIVGPVALGYKRAIPRPIRDGLRNVLNNLHEPVVFVNFLVQLKPGKATETLGRFALDSTLGAAGLFDVARRRPFNLHRRANGFADSLGYYGVKPGPYMFLPIVGPTTPRDLLGGAIDRLMLPLAIGKPFTRRAFAVPTGIVSALNRRVDIDENLNRLREVSPDPYVALRETYLTKRQAEIDALQENGGRESAE